MNRPDIQEAHDTGIRLAARDARDRGIGLVLARLDTLSPSLPELLAHELAALPPFGDGPSGPRALGWLARRRIARAVLGGACHVAPSAIRIEGAPGEAPHAVMPDGVRWSVSFSARRETALIAISRYAIGVDIEDTVAPEAIPLNVLRPDERMMLARLPVEARADAFQHLWTIKEATLKALGTGFALPPEAIRITHDGPEICVSRMAAGNYAFLPAKVLTWPHLPALKAFEPDADRKRAGGSAAAVVILST